MYKHIEYYIKIIEILLDGIFENQNTNYESSIFDKTNIKEIQIIIDESFSAILKKGENTKSYIEINRDKIVSKSIGIKKCYKI